MPRETFGLREEFLAVGPKSVCELKKSDSTWTVDKHLCNLCFSNARRQTLRFPTFGFFARWWASHERQPRGADVQQEVLGGRIFNSRHHDKLQVSIKPR